MRITRLALTDIRRHRALELRPAPGLTVIRGPNESGKSTIQQALELVLFRRATTTAAEIATVRSWGATGDPMIELEFELDGRPGRLVKRFAGTKGSVRLELDGVVDTDPGRVDQLLAAALGIPSEKFFRSTASVRHFEMEDLDRDERALRDRLQASIGGGDVGASRARQRLDEISRRYKAAGARNPGPLLVAQGDIARLSAELRAGEAALEQLSRDRAALAAAAAARATLEEEVRLATESLADAETAVGLDAEQRTVAERYERLRRAADLAERLTAAEVSATVALPLATVRPAVERLRALELGRAQLAAERAAVPLPAPLPPFVPPVVPPAPTVVTGPAALPAALPTPLPVPAVGPPLTRPAGAATPWRPIALVLGPLAVLVLVAGFTVSAIGPIVALVVAVILGASAIGAWIRSARDQIARKTAAAAVEAAHRQAAADAELAARVATADVERAAADAAHAAVMAADEAATRYAAAEQEHRASVQRAQEARAAIDARITSGDAEAAALTTRSGVADLAAAEAMLVAAERHAATVDGLRAELRGSLGVAAGAPVPPVEELRAARDETAAKAALGGHALSGLGATGADPQSARARAQTALRGARLRLGQAIDAEGQAKGRVSQNTADAELVAATAEAIVSRGEDLVALTRRLRIYEQTLVAITAAEAATMQKAARFLERRMGQDMARITGGRYDRVRVDENDLGITVWSAEREAWIDASALSKGTGDQLYLAARLGLVRQVTQDRRPPLVFDDPFVTFDDERALRAVALLRELAADHQVLYLTCSDRYDPAADAVITLAAPGIVPVTPDTVPAPPARTDPYELTLPFASPANEPGGPT